MVWEIQPRTMVLSLRTKSSLAIVARLVRSTIIMLGPGTMVSSLRRINPSPPRRNGWLLKDGNNFCGKVKDRDNWVGLEKHSRRRSYWYAFEVGTMVLQLIMLFVNSSERV